MPKIKKIKKKYSQEDVCAAVESYRAGASLQCASEKYNVPKSTIYFKTKGIVPIDAAMGPSTYLTTKEEERLVEWIFYLGERGFPVTKDQLLDSVRDLVIQLKRKTPFVENRPGRHWYKSFLRRHPAISTRLAQNLTTTRASATEEKLRSWFSEVQIYLDQNGLNGIDATRVYNCDESGFLLCPETGHVLTKKGSKSVYCVVNGVEKECLTTLFMINAAGKMVPPMVLHAYKRVPFNITRKMPKEWGIGVTDNGWMTGQTFYEYIANIFHPWLVKNNTQFPVILFLDGHSSHFTLPLVTFCRTAQIELVALYPNATHILQPLDVAIFHPLKSAWHKTVLKWRVDNNGERLKKEDFAPLLKETIDSMENLENMSKNGFKTCGLYPFSADAVNFNILNKNKKSNTAEKENMNENVTVNREEYTQHLDLFEKNIDSKVLEDFRKAKSSGSWSGQINLEGLFMYWMNIKEKCGKTIRKEKSMDVVHSLSSEDNSTLSLQLANVQNISLDIDQHIVLSNNVTVSEELLSIEDSDIIIDQQPSSNNNQDEYIILIPSDVEPTTEISKDTSNLNLIESNLMPLDLSKNTNLQGRNASPFTTTLFWPKEVEKKTNKRLKEKLPTVATSDDWYNYHTRKEEEKLIKQKQMEDKRRQRAET